MSVSSICDRPDAAPEALIRFEAVSKTYPPRHNGPAVAALEGIDLSVPTGSILGIIGRSGAGKSTLIRLINGLERPSSGRIWVGDAEVSALRERELRALRARVGMIFQHFNLLSSRDAAGNVALPLELAGWAPAAIRARVGELLALVGLGDQAGRYPAELSGGQKQRVGIARALATRPQVLLSDEATSALDPETTRSILALLRRINRDLGLTIVLITHEMSVVRAVADRVAVIEHGAIVEQGSAFTIFTRPQAGITRSLLAGEMGHGLPPALDARIGAEARPGATVALRIAFADAPDGTAILARLARETGIEAAILAGTVDEIGGRPFGSLAIGLPPGPDVAARARAYLANHGFESQVLGYLPPAQEASRVA
ncbi:methionine ABC transporter ATP-binding protein [Methylobacterium sp. J-068]|uniref:methionine ABC transporter ATP-binding protein n=1 Tax=Methylobacterium sp. J-068 TaxID=2836649 RepID=UPI001FBB4574|nr:ATP-binding cassette domain-containing protein [Methylobacterium sp. J-068]MCJ2035144.1 ATP-binding cassette domain-containing protein [Methylobacterium sp. J-068]